MIQEIISWPYWDSHMFIGVPGIGPEIITSLGKIVLTLLKSLENPRGPGYVIFQTLWPSPANICMVKFEISYSDQYQVTIDY